MISNSLNQDLNNKPRYKPDLAEFLNQCELNYFLLNRLWQPPIEIDKREINQKIYNINKKLSVSGRGIELNFKITQQAKYTTTFGMIVAGPKVASSKVIKLIIRMYHDAKLLEVMEGSGPATLKAIYHANQEVAKQTDEKRQINRFVGECLRAVSAFELNKCEVET